MSNSWITNHFLPCEMQVEEEIGTKSEKHILGINTKKAVESYSTRFRLPLIERDRGKRVEFKKVTRLSTRDDVDDPPELMKWDEIQVIYPIKHQHGIDALFRDSRFRFIEFVGDIRYAKGKATFTISRDDCAAPSHIDARKEIGWVEEVINDVNNDIKSGNRFLEGRLTKFIEDLKTAIRKNQAELKQRQKRRAESIDRDDGDWDDDRDQGRTLNDDRSDTLNPNNPAYQDAIDNRADQLNPNNPRYQGRRQVL